MGGPPWLCLGALGEPLNGDKNAGIFATIPFSAPLSLFTQVQASLRLGLHLVKRERGEGGGARMLMSHRMLHSHPPPSAPPMLMSHRMLYSHPPL